MISKILFIIFVMYNSIEANNQSNEKSTPKIKEFIDDNDSLEFLTKIIQNIFGPYDIFTYGLNLSAQCYQNLIQSFFQYGMSISVSSYPYYKKLLLHSSQNKNDLSTYSYCINNNVEDYRGYYMVRNFTYLVILIDDNKSLYEMLIDNNNASSYIIGVCFIDGCNKDDYKIILEKGMEYLNLGRQNNYYNKASNTIQKHELKIYMINENNKSEGFIKFLEILPLIIILFHMLFVIFSSIPIYFYKFILYVFCCRYNKKSSSKNSSRLKSNLIRKKNAKARNTIKHRIFSKIERVESDSSLSLNYNNDCIIKSLELLYNTSNNLKSLLELKKQNEITNDGGLSYINGIKGIAMIFYLFGSVYSNLYSSIITEQNNEEFYSHLNNVFFSIYYIGIKFAPKLLLCTSGFSLFFKFICFLDEKFRSEREIERQNEESEVDGKEVKELKNNNNSNNSEEFSNDNNGNKIISNKYIFIFFGLQIHKYILYILILFFVIYSLDWIILVFQEPGVMWKFFIQSVINPAKDAKYLIPSLIGYRSYFIPYISPENGNILNYFFLVFQEILYFLITTTIIFIGYKKNLRIDYFFEIIFFILIGFRIIYYFISGKLDDKDYFGFSGYGQFYTSLIYDYSFYIIGIHYGMINYIIQKGYTIKDIISQKKKYLSRSLVMLNASRKHNKKLLYTIVFVSCLFLLLNTFIQQIIISIIRNIKSNDFRGIMNYYKSDIFSEIIMLIDSDVFIIAFNSLALCMYLKGDNLINNILCHSFWSIFNRFYFSYIILINPIILYIIYNIDSKINFNLSNCLLYSFICGFFVYLVSIIIYITIELPFKKTIRFWINLSEKGYQDRSGNIEPGGSYNKNDNILLSATASLTDYYEDSEDDEDEY